MNVSTHGPWRTIIKHDTSLVSWDNVTLDCGHERFLRVGGCNEKWTKLRCSFCKPITPEQVK